MIAEWIVIACVFALPACVMGWVAVADVGDFYAEHDALSDEEQWR